jgi:hypothetical protein
MEPGYPQAVTSEILQGSARAGHVPVQRRFRRRAGAVSIYLFLALIVAARVRAQEAAAASPKSDHHSTSGWWLARFAGGFASSILTHEGGHVLAAYAVGGKPSFGFDEGRPTIYSGIDATLEPHKQFLFSSAGLTVQSVLDEGILDAPHDGKPSGAFERGFLAGGIATSLFYVTIGRNGSVSDVEFMQRTSHLSKASITAIYGGVALMHTLRIMHSARYADFFAEPDATGALRVGLRLDR